MQEFIRLLDYAHIYSTEVCPVDSVAREASEAFISGLCRRNNFNRQYIGATPIEGFLSKDSYKCIKTGPAPNIKKV